jgi:hypothetical protein
MKTKTAAALRLKRLYHYQPFDKPERLARMFTEGTIYFSRPREFNDPWDCRPCFSKSGLRDPEEYERTVLWFVNSDRKNTSLPEAEHLRREKELRSNPKLVEWMIDQTTYEMEQAIQNQYRVYCLSTHPDSTLMWSHYADSFKGICLEFSVQNELFCGSLQVEYIGGYPAFSVSATNDDANIQPLLTKSDVWHYESEFRVIASERPFVFEGVPTTDQGFLLLPHGALKSVIIGSLMPERDRELVRSIVHKSGWDVELKIASLIQDRYAFEISRLD